MVVVREFVALEAEVVGEVGEWLRTWLPEVTWFGGGWVAEVTGCERLLGGAEEVARRVVVGAGEWGWARAGVGARRWVARWAAAEAELGGVCVVGDEGSWLRGVSLVRLPGVDREWIERLWTLGVRSIGDLAALDPVWVGCALGARGLELQALACGVEGVGGEGVRRVEEVEEVEEFGRGVDRREVLEARLAGVVERAVSEARRRGRCARRVVVRVRYGDGRSSARGARLRGETTEEGVMPVARGLLGGLLRRRVRVCGIGVSLGGLKGVVRQRVLFVEQEERPGVGVVLDAVRARFGWGAVRLGASCGGGSV